MFYINSSISRRNETNERTESDDHADRHVAEHVEENGENLLRTGFPWRISDDE